VPRSDEHGSARVSAASEVRDLRGDIRHWRRGRVDTKITEALGDAYVTVFASLLLGSMVVSVIVNLRLVSDELCTAGGCQEARTALPWLVGLSALAVVLTLARLFGPVFVSPAIGSWLLSAPVDRSALLRPRLIWTAAIAALFSGLFAAGASTLGGFGIDPLLAFCGSTALLALAAVCLAALSGPACCWWPWTTDPSGRRPPPCRTGRGGAWPRWCSPRWRSSSWPCSASAG
jgi:hypothetical protein